MFSTLVKLEILRRPEKEDIRFLEHWKEKRMILMKTDISMFDATHLKCKWLNFFYLVAVQSDLSQMLHSFKSLKMKSLAARKVVTICGRVMWQQS